MTDAPTTERLARTLSALLRRLTSEQMSEAEMAAKALLRLSQSEELSTIRQLAHRLEQPTPPEADIRKAYDVGYGDGYGDGVKATEQKQWGDEEFCNINGAPSWADIALYCHRRADRLNEWEQGFVCSMAAWTLTREPTSRQAPKLKAIYLRLGGRL